MYPPELKYTKEHEWVNISGSTGKVGITDYAQKQLGDVVHVELPEVGRQVGQGQPFGEIESVKAVSVLFSPMSGEVVEVNEELRNDESAKVLNENPHGTWMISLRLSDPSETASLLSNTQYEELVK